MSSTLQQVRLILKNDLRLLVRGLMARKFSTLWAAVLIGLGLLLFHAVAILVFAMLPEWPGIVTEAMVWAFFAFLMLGASMTHAISLLFEKSDLDLLLCAPVSARVVLVTRLLTICAGAWLSSAFLLLPLLNGAVFGLAPMYLCGYLTWCLLALLCASAGTGATLAVVRWIGARRARMWVQIVGAITGAFIYLAFQSHRFVPDGEANAVWDALRSVVASRPGLTVAQSARGSVPDLLALSLVALGSAYFAVRLLASTFIEGLQQLGERSRSKRSSGKFQLREGLMNATFWKEMRLIRRDPLLLSQVLPSIMYIAPAFFGARTLGGMQFLAPVSVIVGVQFSLLLTSVAVSGEEGLDLIRSSPTPEVRLRIAKMAAAMALPLAASLVVCIVLGVAGHPILATVAFVTTAATALGCTWLKASEVTPTPRGDVLRRRGSGFTLRNVAAVTLMIVAAGSVGALASDAGRWIGAWMLGALALCLVACFVFVSPKEMTVNDAAA